MNIDHSVQQNFEALPRSSDWTGTLRRPQSSQSWLCSPLKEYWGASRIIGVVLVAVAFLAGLADAVGGIDINTAAGILSAVALLICIAITRTPRGITSLVGLFFVPTILFVFARPLLLYFEGSEEMFDWGGLMIPVNGADQVRLLLFWSAGIAALFGGYFMVTDRRVWPSTIVPSKQVGDFCRFSFWITAAILVLLLPLLIEIKLRTFISLGYEALYVGQADQSFSALGVLSHLDLLVSVLFALSVVLAEKVYIRVMAALALLFSISSIVVGQRGVLGSWILVGLWYLSNLRGRKLNRAILVSAAALIGVFFQAVELWRGQVGDGGDAIAGIAFICRLFIISQGIAYLVPFLSWNIQAPPLPALIGSVLPVGKLLVNLGVGSMETATFPNYVVSQVAPERFARGEGLASNIYIETYYLCGAVLFVFIAACIVLGILLRQWEWKAGTSIVARFLLCVSLPGVFLSQRESFLYITSPVCFALTYMTGMAVLYWISTYIRRTVLVLR